LNISVAWAEEKIQGLSGNFLWYGTTRGLVALAAGGGGATSFIQVADVFV